MTNVVMALALVFSDNMVLQHDAPVPVWGTAVPGEQVIVEFAGQKKSAAADTAGSWRVTLDPMPVNTTPQTLHASRFTLHDVLVGDVWVCAGQSNMEFPLAKESHAKEELPAATNPNLRLLNMPFAGQYTGAKRFSAVALARMTPEKFYSGSWQPCTPESAKDFSAVGYYFGKETSQKIPVGLVNLAVGGSPAEAWIRREVLPSELPLDPWCLKRMRDNLGNNKTHHPFEPGFLWDAGIARLIPFAIRGVIWYQGESNAETDWRVQQHETLFPLLVRDWRAQWAQGDFPFYYVQLSSLNRTNWPAFRDQQRRLLDAIPNSGMVVTTDLGHPTDVHPRNKRDVGHRLALLASENRRSPLPQSAKLENNHIIVTFAHAADGLRTSDNKPPRGFEITGTDGVYRDATAELRGTTVIVPAGVTVRYAWKPFTDANVVNSDGLPASTFQLKVTP